MIGQLNDIFSMATDTILQFSNDILAIGGNRNIFI